MISLFKETVFWIKRKLRTFWKLLIRKIYHFQLLIPFCNQKRYFTFFKFWRNKMAMNQKIANETTQNWGIADRKNKSDMAFDLFL